MKRTTDSSGPEPSNAAPVLRVREVIEGLGLEIASPDEAHAILQLKGGDQAASDSLKREAHLLHTALQFCSLNALLGGEITKGLIAWQYCLQRA